MQCMQEIINSSLSPVSGQLLLDGLLLLDEGLVHHEVFPLDQPQTDIVLCLSAHFLGFVGTALFVCALHQYLLHHLFFGGEAELAEIRVVDEFLLSCLWGFLAGNLLFGFGNDSDRDLGCPWVPVFQNGRFFYLLGLAVCGNAVFRSIFLLFFDETVFV